MRSVVWISLVGFAAACEGRTPTPPSGLDACRLERASEEFGQVPDRAERLTRAAALERLRDDGRLAPSDGWDAVLLEEPFELAAIADVALSTSTVEFRRVWFSGGLDISRAPPFEVKLEDCDVAGFRADRNVVWPKRLVIIGGRIHHEWSSPGNHYRSGLVIEDVAFEADTLFDATSAEFQSLVLRDSRLPDLVGLSSIRVKGPAQLERITGGRESTNLFGSVLNEGLDLDRAELCGTLNLREAHLGAPAHLRGSSVGELLLEVRGTSTGAINLIEVEVAKKLCFGDQSARLVTLSWDQLGAAILACEPSRTLLTRLADTRRSAGDEAEADMILDYVSDPKARMRKVLAWSGGGAGVIGAIGLALVVGRARDRRRRRVFLSYRRKFAWKEAGLIAKGLGQRPISAFMDVKDIGLGKWPDKLDRAVRRSDALLVVMEQGWADHRDDDGGLLLHREHDWVRIEIETALEEGILIVPVLLEGSELPRTEMLPVSLRSLTKFQLVRFRDVSWNDDLESLRRLLLEHPPRSRERTSNSVSKTGEESAADVVRDAPKDG